MNKKFNLIKILFVIAFASCCFIYGRIVPFSEQLPVYDSVLTISAIVFGVMGAWIAVIYPHIHDIDHQNQENEEDYKHFKKMLIPMTYAAFGLFVFIIIRLLAPIFKTIPFLVAYKTFFRGLSYATLGTICILQLWSVIYTFYPYDTIAKSLDRKKRRSQIKKNMFPNSRPKQS